MYSRRLQSVAATALVLTVMSAPSAAPAAVGQKENQTAAAVKQPDDADQWPGDPAVLHTLQGYQAEGWVGSDISVQIGPVQPLPFNQTELALKEFQLIAQASRQFARGHRYVGLTVYKFKTTQGAYGAYTNLRRGATTVVVRGDSSSEDDQSLSFWQADYYVHVWTTAEADDEAKDMMRVLANQLAAAIGKHAELPSIVMALPQLDRLSGSERLIMGSSVAHKALSLPYVDALKLDESLGACFADYQFKLPIPERMRLLLVDYGSAQASSIAYKRYCECFSEDHEDLGNDRSALFKVQKNYVFCQPHGRLLAVISGARSRHSPVLLGRQLGLIAPLPDSLPIPAANSKELSTPGSY